VDVKRPEFEPTAADEFELLDLRRWDACLEALRGADRVFALAANMGGIGFIEAHKAEIMRDNALINLHTIEAARVHGVKRFLFTSSACVYAAGRQKDVNVVPLKEEDAYPADAEDGYGWEKLFMERQCRHYREDYGLDTRVVRFHNIYGPLGTWDGGREKAPAAVSRKIAMARDGDEIEVWGDGKQTRSFCHVDDCVEGLLRLMASDWTEPLNLGTDRLISVDDLFHLVAKIAGKRIRLRHDLAKPVGVRGRNSDNARLREVLHWEPAIPLEEGMKGTFRWIEAQVRERDRRAAAR
jgi:nucleoside-diphosphate-sugar epimerase